MSTLLERYHNWRLRTFYASKEDVSWRYESLVAHIAQCEQSITRTIEAASAAERAQRASVDVQTLFPLFRPNSAGDEFAKDALTIQAVQQIFPFLQSFATRFGARSLNVVDIRSFPKTEAAGAAAEALAALFNEQASDKSNYHNYHCFYGPVLSERVSGVLEIGLGTSNTDVVSNMGAQGSPGASLRAFRDYLPQAQIYGADVDRRILFEDDRIKTYFVDQTDPESFSLLDSVVPAGLDLVIDDGLHSPNANIVTLGFGMSKIRTGGWVAIEDIDIEALPFWNIVAALLPASFESVFLLADKGNIFAVNKVS